MALLAAGNRLEAWLLGVVEAGNGGDAKDAGPEEEATTPEVVGPEVATPEMDVASTPAPDSPLSTSESEAGSDNDEVLRL